MAKFYRCLLFLYPREIRRDFGEEMSGVFSVVMGQARCRGRLERVRSSMREICGVLRGACVEQVRSNFGSSVVYRRIAMSSIRLRFRFPIAGISFMTLCLGIVVYAIHLAREVAAVGAGKHVLDGQIYHYQPERLSFLQTFGFAFGLTAVCAVVIWAVLHKLHQSGVERLSEVQTWPQQ